MPLAHTADQKVTVEDYRTWPDEERWELIDGVPYSMTPAPSPRHQRVVVRLVSRLEAALEGKPCTVFASPTDVVLSDYDVVQPDVFIVCDPSKITAVNIAGAPDVVFELLSPSTALKDRKTKRDLYARFGVKEYILVDPEGQYAERMLLGEDGSYGKPEILGPMEQLKLSALEDVTIVLAEIFEISEVEQEVETPEPERPKADGAQ